MAPLLRVQDLAVTFTTASGEVRAVDGVSFDVARGRTVALVGESGSGKSVTAQAILRLLPKSARIVGGSMLFSETPGAIPLDLARLDPSSGTLRRLRGGRIAMVFQDPMTSLSPLHTVGDQVSEALLAHEPVSRKEALERARAALERVGFPDPARALDTYPFELSGGLRQRAMIAMALITRPALLIADEPTTALDMTTQAGILDLIRDLQADTGMAVLMITHDLGVVANVADEVVVLYRGRVMEAGGRNALFRHPRHPYFKALLHAVPRFHMEPGERLTPIRDVRPPLPERREPAPAGAGPVLAVCDVRKTYTLRAGLFSGTTRLVHAVNGVSLHLMPGETLGLVGESGSGKTTLIRMVLRSLDPDSGTIAYDDGTGPADVHRLSGEALARFRRAVGFVFQDPYSSLNPRMTALEIVTEPLRIGGAGREARYRRAKALMDMVGLPRSSLGRYPHAFSGGQRQRLGIARALALEPRILICDEPVSALDVSVQAQILNLLRDLQGALGLSCLFVSHNLAVVDYMAERICVMCRGLVVEEAPRAALFRNPVHPYTRTLLAAVPEPDPDHPLDFAALRRDRLSDPRTWPAPFTLAPGEAGVMHEIEPGHRVRRTAKDRQEAA
ncbi:ABC transporter ATP-binding protein [Salinarimonas soli]|nr:ABC transporter ATP-binding protein [Salinarimonas soli]